MVGVAASLKKKIMKSAGILKKYVQPITIRLEITRIRRGEVDVELRYIDQDGEEISPVQIIHLKANQDLNLTGFYQEITLVSQ